MKLDPNEFLRKIVTSKEKSKIMMHISLTVLLKILFLCTLLSVIIVTSILFYYGPDHKETSGLSSAIITLFFIMIIEMNYIEKRDPVKQYSLNEKIFISLNILNDLLNKSNNSKGNFFNSLKINTLIYFIYKKAKELQNNIENQFLFFPSRQEKELNNHFYEFINRLWGFIKNGKATEAKIVINKILNVYCKNTLITSTLYTAPYSEEEINIENQSLILILTELLSHDFKVVKEPLFKRMLAHVSNLGKYKKTLTVLSFAAVTVVGYLYFNFGRNNDVISVIGILSILFAMLSLIQGINNRK